MINATVIGNLGGDADVKQIGKTPAAVFRIASTNTGGKDKGTTWVTCTLFGETRAANLAPFLTKGKKVVVSGSLNLREYDKTDGSGKGYSLDLRVDELEFADGGKKDEDTTFP